LNLSEFEKYRENNRLEAKRAQGRDGAGELPHSMWETLSAFANEAGGVILLGVAEVGSEKRLEAVGLAKANKMLDDFWSAANSKDKLSARFLMDRNARIETVEGKDIIVIDVPRVDRHMRPVYLDKDLLGKTFRRTYTGDHQCSEEEVFAMIRESSTLSKDAEIARTARVEELDQDTITRYRRRFDSENENHVWADMDDAEFLDAVGATAVDADGAVKPTCAGLLMFGEERFIRREFPHYFLDYRQETGGNDRWDDRVTSMSGDWTGNVYDFYFRVYNKMKAALKVPFKLVDGSRVDDTPAHAALRESLANCLTNADWHERRGVVCVWGADAFTIANPGGFRMPIEEARKPGSSDPRNETLLRMFSMIDVGERAGSGMDKIFNGWAWVGCGEPTYTVGCSPDRTTLTLPLQAESDDYRQIKSSDSFGEKTAMRSGKTTQNKQAIAEYLTINGPSKSSDIALAVGLKTTRTNQILREMIAAGVVKAEGQARSREYRLVD